MKAALDPQASVSSLCNGLELLLGLLAPLGETPFA